MGLYPINCPACSKPHMWFSGNSDQRCETCRLPREWEIQEAQTTLLTPDLRVAQRRFPGQVDASPYWIPVIEKSAYDFQCKQLTDLGKTLNDSREYYQAIINDLQSQVDVEKAEVARLLAKLKCGKRRG